MPLKVSINKVGRITISLSARDLAYAATFLPDLEELDDASGEFLVPKVVDRKAFADAVLGALEAEQEDGTTPVHLMLDAAILEAIEQGAEGILLPSDPQYGRKKFAK